MNTEKRPVLCTTLYRKPMQPSNFDCILHQLRHWKFSHSFHQNIRFKGELNPEMKLCELLALGHCIHLPLILVACVSFGQSYNIGSPVAPIFVTTLTQRWLETPLRFEVFWTFIKKYSFDRSRRPVCLSLPYYACLVKFEELICLESWFKKRLNFAFLTPRLAVHRCVLCL